MLLVVRTCAVFDFFPVPAFVTLFRGEGGFKVFAFDILKVFLVAPLYFSTDCKFTLKHRNKKNKTCKFLYYYASLDQKQAKSSTIA